MKARFDAVLIDLDGLLADTEALGQDAMADIWRQAGHRELEASELALYIGRPDREVFVELGRQRGLETDEVDRLHRVYRQRYLERLRQHPLEPLPGVRKGLLRLASRHPLALVTGSTRDQAESVLAQLGLAGEHWRAIVTADEVESGKPDPAPYLDAASRLGVSIHRCLVVEDSVPGALAGRGAGAAVLHVGSFHPQTSWIADRQVDRLDRVDDALLRDLWEHRPLPARIDVASLGELGRRLFECELVARLGAVLANGSDLWPAYLTAAQEPPALDRATGALWRLLVAGEGTAVEKLQPILDVKLLTKMADTEILDVRGRVEIAARPRLLSVGGLLLFKEPPRLLESGRPLSCETYLENSSLTFLRVVLDDLERRAVRPRRVLEMGSGTGLALLRVLADFPEASGTGVDLDGRAVHLARANAAMNRLEHRVDFLQGDLFAPLSEERFDLILFHPPYRLMPDEVPYPDPLSRYGTGNDGLGVVVRFLAGLGDHLAEKGEALLLIELPHDEQNPGRFERKLRQVASELVLDLRQIGRDVTVAEIARIGADKCLQGDSEEHLERISEAYSAIGADHLRPVLLRVHRG